MSFLGGPTIWEIAVEPIDDLARLFDAERCLRNVGQALGIGDLESASTSATLSTGPHLPRRLAHGANSFVVAGVTDQDHRAAFVREADRLEMDLGHERARGIDRGQATGVGLLTHCWADAVGAVDQAAPLSGTSAISSTNTTPRRRKLARRDCCGQSRDRRKAAARTAPARSRVWIAITTPAQKPCGLASQDFMVRSLPCGDLACPRLPAREAGPNPAPRAAR